MRSADDDDDDDDDNDDDDDDDDAGADGATRRDRDDFITWWVKPPTDAMEVRAARPNEAADLRTIIFLWVYFLFSTVEESLTE